MKKTDFKKIIKEIIKECITEMEYPKNPNGTVNNSKIKDRLSNWKATGTKHGEPWSNIDAWRNDDRDKAYQQWKKEAGIDNQLKVKRANLGTATGDDSFLAPGDVEPEKGEPTPWRGGDPEERKALGLSADEIPDDED